MKNIVWVTGKEYKEMTPEADDAAFSDASAFPLVDGDVNKVDWRLFHSTRHKKMGEKFGSGKPAPTYQELLKEFGISFDALQTLCEADGVPSPNYFDLLRMHIAKQKPKKKDK